MLLQVVSKVSDLPSDVRLQHVNNTQPTLNNCGTEDENMFNIQLSYDINQALNPEFWDGNFRAILIHSSMEHLASNINNIKESLGRIQKYILGKTIERDNANNIKDLEGVGKAVWDLILSLYEAYWDSLYVNDQKTSFRNKVKSKFSLMALNNMNNSKGKNKVNPPYVSMLSLSIPAKSPKEINKISKFFKKNHPLNVNKKSYTQASSNGSNSNSTNMARETLKIKKAFPSLQNKKIEQIQKIISGVTNPKPHINMTTKEPLYKQVIIPMCLENANNFVKKSSVYVANINRAFKNIKSDVIADFIWVENKSIVISTNKVTNPLDLQTIENYVKSTCSIEADQMESLRLPQSKSYLKLIGIPYLSEKTNSCITSDEVDNILKNTYIFNDVVLALKPRVIKISPKSNMAIVWINIWDAQSGIKVKSLINRRFNVGSFIATIHGANINPGVSQCKNCWK